VSRACAAGGRAWRHFADETPIGKAIMFEMGALFNFVAAQVLFWATGAVVAATYGTGDDANGTHGAFSAANPVQTVCPAPGLRDGRFDPPATPLPSRDHAAPFPRTSPSRRQHPRRAQGVRLVHRDAHPHAAVHGRVPLEARACRVRRAGGARGCARARPRAPARPPQRRNYFRFRAEMENAESAGSGLARIHAAHS
jgi:hypothetical protein